MDLIGHTVIWSIGRGPHPRHRVRDRFAEANLGIDIADVDTIGNAWRRATGEQLPTYGWTGPSGRRLEARLEKQDVQMLRRKKNVRSWHRTVPGIAPREVMKSQLGRKSKTSSRISWDITLAPGLGEDERAQLLVIRDNLNARVEELLTNLDGSKVRSTIREILEGELEGIAMRGGVYFVPARHGERLMALEGVFDVLKESFIDVLPLVGTDRTRARVMDLLIRQTRDDVRDFASMYSGYIDKGAVSEHVAGKAEREALAIMNRSYAYIADLGIDDGSDDPVHEANDELQVILDKLKALRS